MNRLIAKGIGVAAMAAALMVSTAARSDAAFVAYICDDLSCSGGGDIIVTDNGAGDLGLSGTIDGRINMEASVGGLTIVTNVAKSKPLVGSAGSPVMDITFSAEGIGTAYIFASDTGFTGITSLHGTLDGNFSGSSCVQGGIGVNGANTNSVAVAATTALTCESPFSLQVAHSGAVTSPYALTLGLYVSRSTAGTTTGDFLVVPEPASLGLLGLGLAGLATRRRRQAI